MKFCYLDETGIGQKSVVVIVGVIVDALRMHRTKQEWDELLTAVNKLVETPLSEIKSTRLIPRKTPWGTENASRKLSAVDMILDWFSERKHEITFAAVDQNRFRSLPQSDERKKDLNNPEIAAAFHIALTLQKVHQSEKKNKGHTFLIFDRGKEPPQLTDLISASPSWSDSYYITKRKKRGNEGLDQIVDAPYYAESHRVVLIQFADLVCHILRRYAELEDYEMKEKWQSERDIYQGWIKKIQTNCIDSSHRYKKRGACDTSKFFSALAPKSLRKL